MAQLQSSIVFATLAGAMIPLGGILARVEHIRPQWLEEEFRHSVIAFGGGILFAAVSLVLVPQATIDFCSCSKAAQASSEGPLGRTVSQVRR
jgi:hypothetical protein